jgi:RNA polymerase sigma factor (sigma-70 family)
MTDRDLLHAYVSDRSQSAFGELVRRHAPMVMSVAQRAGTGMADDVVQSVFVALANKAATVDGRCLAGWLYRAAGHAARHAARTAARRRRYESQAARSEVAPMSPEPDSPSPEQLAELHAALGRLSDVDRSSVLHRFARGLSFAAVGHELGVGEEAARKRVDRAVGKLRRLMTAPELPDCALAAALVRPASDGLLTQLAAAAHAAHPPAAAATAKAVIHGLQRAKLPATSAATAALAAVAGGVGWLVLHRSAPPTSIVTPTVHRNPPATSPPARQDAASTVLVSPPRRPRPPSAEPPLASGPAQTYRLVNRPSLDNRTGTEFLNGGVQVARAGGTLNGTEPHCTGTSIFAVNALPSGGLSLTSTTAGFPVYKAAFAPNGQRAAYSTIDWNETGHNRLFVADMTERGADQPVLLEEGPGWYDDVAISADGRRAAATVFSSDLVQLWDVEARRKIATLDPGRSENMLAFDPAGRWLLTGPRIFNSDPTVRLWDVATGKLLARLVGHTGYLKAMAFAPDGHEAATVDSDGAIWFWSLPDGHALAKVDCPWETIEKLAFSPDGKLLLAATDTACARTKAESWVRQVRLRLWDVATATPLIKFEAQDRPVTAVTFAPGGRSILTEHAGKVNVWELPAHLPRPDPGGPPALPTQPTGGETARFPFPDGGTITFSGGSIAFSPDGRTVTAGGGSKFQSWDLATGRAGKSFTGSNFAGLIRPDLDVYVDGSRNAAAGHDHGFAVLYRLSTGRELQRIGTPDFPCINYDNGDRAMDLSPDGRLIALAGGCKNGRINGRISPGFMPRLEVFHSADGTSAYRVGGNVETVRALKFSPDGKRLYVAGGWQDGPNARDCAIRVLAADTGADLATYTGLSGVPKGLALSGDGRKLWAATEGGTVDGWDTATGRAIAHVYQPVTAYAIAASPDGRTVAVGRADHNIVLIDAATGTLTRRLGRHTGSVMAVSFSPDSSKLASVSTDNTVRVWDLTADR